MIFATHRLINRQSRDIRRDDYVIESMHKIDSNQIKYPSARDKKSTRDGITFYFPLSMKRHILQ